jgi:hypothetical protein
MARKKSQTSVLPRIPNDPGLPYLFEKHPVGLVGRNFEGHVGIQISHEMLSCMFSKFDLEILEQWKIVTCQLTRRWGKLADFFFAVFLNLTSSCK